MSEREISAAPTNLEADGSKLDDLSLRLSQLEAEKGALQAEVKTLRELLERTIAHRQTSHSELIILLATLVGKLPMNDVGGLVARLVEHNTNVGHYLSALIKGTAEAHIEKPSVLKSLEQARRDLKAAIKPLVEELGRLETPLEREVLQNLPENPDLFFSPKVIRATRCFLKAQLPRERVTRQFGEEALVLFNDLTTDPKLNPRPKPDEIVLGFKSDFESLVSQYPNLASKREELMALFGRVQKCKTVTDQGRLQKNVFLRLSFVIELLHYYENQNTETPEVIFAHRLPALVEQLVLPCQQDELDQKLIVQAEELMAHILNPDHRQMVINNTGKTGEAAKTLKFVLKLRSAVPDTDHVVLELMKHLILPGQPPPAPGLLARLLRLVPVEMQRRFLRALLTFERLRKEQAEMLAKQTAAQLGIEDAFVSVPKETVTPEFERQMAWVKIKDLIGRRSDPGAVAAAIRERISAKFDAEEIRQSWIMLTEADPMSFIRIFCQLPYGASGKTEAIARPIMETYVSRLTHDKYAPTYNRVVTSLRNMFHAKPDSPTLLNFTALVRWVSEEAGNKLSNDVGMGVHA